MGDLGIVESSARNVVKSFRPYVLKKFQRFGADVFVNCAHGAPFERLNVFPPFGVDNRSPFTTLL